MRFYPAARTVVNVFAPRQLRVARAPRVAFGVAPKINRFAAIPARANRKVRDSRKLSESPARETHALPNRLGERPALAADSGAASVSYGVSEWALVWVSVSDCLRRRLWQLASELQLAWPSQLPWLSQSVSRWV